MKRYLALSVTTGLMLLGVGCGLDRVRGGDLSADKLDMLDQAGYFTPAFKQAVHQYIESKQALADEGAENQKMTLELPSLQQQATESEAKTVALRQELAKYEHPDETDFAALQAKMNDSGAKLEDQIALAQAYVWTYPASPHEAEAQSYLQQTQKKQADEIQAEKDAEAAREAAHAKLVQGAQARDLNIGEWRELLRDMSQDDLVKLIGHPSSDTGDYWIYNGGWSTDATTQKKVGLQINFDAGRVLNVDEIPAPP